MDAALKGLSRSADLFEEGRRVMRDPKRRKVGMTAQQEEQLLNDITNFLTHNLPNIPLQGDEKLEVELRLGHYIKAQSGARGSPIPNQYSSTDNSRGFRFEASVSRQDWFDIQKELGKSPTVKKKHTSSHTYMCGSSVRVHYDPEREEVISAETKRTALSLNIFLPHCKYDMRVNIAVESPMEKPNSAPQRWEMARQRERVSYLEQNPDGMSAGLTFDLTRVNELSKGQMEELRVSPETSYEVELEYAGGTPVQDIDPYDLATRLWGSVGQFLKPPEDEAAMEGSQDEPNEDSPVPYIRTEPLTSSSEAENLRQMTLYFCGRDTGERRFPGTLPVAFRRSHIKKIQGTRDHFVSEKTDGVRFFLLSTGGSTYFVDRKFHFHKVVGFNSLYGVLKESLIDGEVVINRQTNKPQFMIFDMLAYNNQSIAHFNLSERFKSIPQVVGAYREAIMSGTIPEEHPFVIIGKVFHPANMISRVTQCIEDHGVYRLYNDKAKRCHKTDGIIVTPDCPYLFGTAFDCLKWKFADKITIDVWVHCDQMWEIQQCSCTNGHGEVPMKMIKLGREDQTRLVGEMRKLSMYSIIAEVGYHPDSGLWRFHTLRPDKDRPNFIDTVFDSMLQLADNISIEELRYRLARTPQDDSWHQELEKLSNVPVRKY